MDDKMDTTDQKFLARIKKLNPSINYVLAAFSACVALFGLYLFCAVSMRDGLWMFVLFSTGAGYMFVGTRTICRLLSIIDYLDIGKQKKE